MAATTVRNIPIVIRGKVREAERRLKVKLRSVACSEYWVEAQIRYTPAVDNKGREVAVAEHVKGVFPVPGMGRCKCCERHYPPTYLTAREVCQDCVSESAPAWWINAQPSSCSTFDMGKVKAAIRRGAAVAPVGIV